MEVGSGHLSGRAPSTVRKTVFGAEAIWWLMRPHDATGVLAIGAIGWFTSRGAEADWSLFWSLFTIVLGTGVVHLVNDLADEEKDRVTAPYLPLPAGLVARPVVMATAIGGMPVVIFLLVMVVGPAHPLRVVSALALIALIAILTSIYSSAKESGVLGSVVATIPIISLVLLAWISGGAERPHMLAATLPFIGLTAFAGTLYAALRDLDRDADVDNYTIPVTIGGPATLRLAAVLEGAGLLLVAIAAVAIDELAVLWLCGLAALVLAAAYQPYSRRLGEPDRGRPKRLADSSVWAIGGFLRSVAMIAMLTDFAHPWWVLFGALTYLLIWRALRWVYAVRIIRGGLGAQLGGRPTP